MRGAVRIITSFAMLPITYFVWSFVLAEFNPWEWGADGRAAMVGFGVIFGVANYTYPGWWVE